MIREADSFDKTSILKFCKDTFSWGDYIDQIWDFWISEGNLFLFENPTPVGICHAFYSNDQIWIEGIRVDPSSHRQKIASNLIAHAESIGKEKNIRQSYMLIDTKNTASLSMASSLDYDVFQTWHFYSLTPKINHNHNVSFEKSLNLQSYPSYVKSWRWFPIDDTALSIFYKQNKIVKSTMNNKNSIAILTDSEHFEKTLIVTLFSGSQNTTLEIISFLQNYAIQNNYTRIQILSKEQIPSFDSLELRISFYLVKKLLI